MLRDIVGKTVAVPIGGTVLSSNVLIALNESGAFLWSLLVKGGTEDEITAAFCTEYDVDSEVARKDICDFVEYLKSNKVEIE